MEAGINLLIAGGFTGQTTEFLGGVERIAGVRLPSYIAASYTYRFKRR